MPGMLPLLVCQVYFLHLGNKLKDDFNPVSRSRVIGSITQEDRDFTWLKAT